VVFGWFLSLDNLTKLSIETNSYPIVPLYFALLIVLNLVAIGQILTGVITLFSVKSTSCSLITLIMGTLKLIYSTITQFRLTTNFTDSITGKLLRNCYHKIIQNIHFYESMISMLSY